MKGSNLFVSAVYHPVFLIRHPDPLHCTVQGPAQGGHGCWAGCTSAQMGGHHMLQGGSIQTGQQFRRHVVGQMAMAAADTALEEGRVDGCSQQIRIVVAFEEQAIAGLQ